MYMHTYMKLIRIIPTCNFPLSTTGIASLLFYHLLTTSLLHASRVSETICPWTKMLSNDDMKEQEKTLC